MNQRVGGIIDLKVNGQVQNAKGAFTYNIGSNKRTGVAGADVVHGYTETVQVPYIEGEITDRQTLNLRDLLDMTDGTVVLGLANGKSIVLRNAWYAGEGEGNTEEGAIGVRWEGLSAEEVPA